MDDTSRDGAAGAAGDDLVVRGEELTKDYGAHRVLNGVALSVARASFLVLLGPSGSGKTTLLRCIAGTERLTRGALWIEGRAVATPELHLAPERRGLSMVFQDYALWPHMTVAENVGFALRRLSRNGSERHRRALAMLDRLGLSEQATRYPNQLSGGQQQRVALARALVAGTPLLLCDEPLSNLDAHLREQVRVEIATLSRDAGATVVYITHDQQEAFALADQVAVIHEGRILQTGAPEEVYRRPATPFVARFTGLAGSLRGEVAARSSPARVQVRTGEGSVEAIAMPGAGRSGAVELLLRTDALRIEDGDAEAALTGVVRDSSFRAGAYDHVVDLRSGPRLTGVRSARRAPRGGAVRISVSPEGCLAFPVANEEVEAGAGTAAAEIAAAPAGLHHPAGGAAAVPVPGG